MPNLEERLAPCVRMVRCLRETYSHLSPRTRRAVLRDVRRALQDLDAERTLVVRVPSGSRDGPDPVPVPVKCGVQCKPLLPERPMIGPAELARAVRGVRRALPGMTEEAGVKVLSSLESLMISMGRCPAPPGPNVGEA